MESAFRAYLEDDSRLGPAAGGAATGAAGGAACGDLARISLVVEGGRVGAVSFDTEGCAAMRAATAAAAEAAEGATVLGAARLGAGDLEAALGGLVPAKLHAAQLAADALHRALAAAAASGADLALPPPAGERVLVAMSGGVDSAVAALLERERGADVAAVTVKLWADPRTDGAKACCSPEAVVGARRLAHSLGLPHFTLDLEEQFRGSVVGEFVRGHAEGRTPNPCVLCNGEVRIAAMASLAGRLGAGSLATGHYARVVDDGHGPLLGAAADPAKDQSYMLAALPPELVGRLRFPLAGLTKPEVREIAARHGLAVARKPDSQDLCFLAGTGKREFLRRHGRLRDREGAIVDERGRRLGRHRGHHHFTVGQRKGIGIAAPEPFYVLSTDAVKNTVVVGGRDRLATRAVRLADAILHRPGTAVDTARLRYRSDSVPASVEAGAEAGHHASLGLSLHEAFEGAAPGQTAVLYRGNAIVGHGRIASA
jgi:tRNA-specific 2-thiouridylase